MASFLEKMGFIQRVEDASNTVIQNVMSSESVNEIDTSESNTEINEATDIADGLDFVQRTYTTNGIPQDTPTSIFKVQEIGSQLPSTLPTKQKQSSVLGLLKSFNISVIDLLDDGEKRIDLLNKSLDGANEAFDDSIQRMEQEIENAKELISNNNTSIMEITERKASFNSAVAKEINSIQVLCEFITPKEES